MLLLMEALCFNAHVMYCIVFVASLWHISMLLLLDDFLVDAHVEHGGVCLWFSMNLLQDLHCWDDVGHGVEWPWTSI